MFQGITLFAPFPSVQMLVAGVELMQQADSHFVQETNSFFKSLTLNQSRFVRGAKLKVFLSLFLCGNFLVSFRSCLRIQM